MKISKTELIKALDIVKPGLSTSDNIEQSTSFAFMEDRIVTYNDSISISTLFKSGVTGAVSAKEIYTLLNKISNKTDNINLRQEDNELLIGIGKGESAGIKLEKEIQLPLNEINTEHIWKKIPKNLIEALLFCSFSTTKDLSKPLLTCIHVKNDMVESTDNKRATNYKLNGKIFGEFLIPVDSVKFLRNFNAIKYSLTDSWVSFLADNNAIFSCRVFNEKFPNISGVMDIVGKKMKFPEELIDAIDKAVIFCENDDSLSGAMVDITLMKNLIIIKGIGKVGHYTKKTKIKYIGDSFTFSVSSKFFIDMLKVTDSCHIDKENKKIKFSFGNWNHMFRLMSEE